MAAVKHRLDPTRLKLVYKRVHKNGAGQAVYVMAGGGGGGCSVVTTSKQKRLINRMNLVVNK